MTGDCLIGRWSCCDDDSQCHRLHQRSHRHHKEPMHNLDDGLLNPILMVPYLMMVDVQRQLLAAKHPSTSLHAAVVEPGDRFIHLTRITWQETHLENAPDQCLPMDQPCPSRWRGRQSNGGQEKISTSFFEIWHECYAID